MELFSLNVLIFLLLLGLGTTRLTLLFVKEEGPLQFFIRIRRYFGIETFETDYGTLLVPLPQDKYDFRTFMSGVLSCSWCFSIWAALGLLITFLIHPVLFLVINLILSASLINILINTNILSNGE